MNRLKVLKARPDAHIPKYQTAGAACFDLHAAGTPGVWLGAVCAGLPLVVDTGLKVEVPEGHVMLVFSRSGHGFRDDVRLANCVGVIDSDYRGTVMVKLAKEHGSYMQVHGGDRIAQAMLVKIDQWDLVEVDALSETERGENGGGSTGVAAC